MPASVHRDSAQRPGISSGISFLIPPQVTLTDRRQAFLTLGGLACMMRLVFHSSASTSKQVSPTVWMAMAQADSRRSEVEVWVGIGWGGV